MEFVGLQVNNQKLLNCLGRDSDCSRPGSHRDGGARWIYFFHKRPAKAHGQSRGLFSF